MKFFFIFFIVLIVLFVIRTDVFGYVLTWITIANIGTLMLIIVVTLLCIGVIRLVCNFLRIFNYNKMIERSKNVEEKIIHVKNHCVKDLFRTPQQVEINKSFSVYFNEGMYEKALSVLDSVDPQEDGRTITFFDAITILPIMLFFYMLFSIFPEIGPFSVARKNTAQYSIQYNRMMCYFALGDLDKGLELSKECDETFYGWAKPKKSEKGIHLYQHIVIRLKIGKYDEARELIKEFEQLYKNRSKNRKEQDQILLLWKTECDINDGVITGAKEKLNSILDDPLSIKHFKIQAKTLLEKVEPFL